MRQVVLLILVLCMAFSNAAHATGHTCNGFLCYKDIFFPLFNTPLREFLEENKEETRRYCLNPNFEPSPAAKRAIVNGYIHRRFREEESAKWLHPEGPCEPHCHQLSACVAGEVYWSDQHVWTYIRDDEEAAKIWDCIPKDEEPPVHFDN